MPAHINNLKIRRGMTLIDVVIGAALLSFVFVGIVSIFQSSIQLTQYTKAKIGALALANEAIEFTRSITYDDVGTISGIPSGVLPQFETITLNGVEYTKRMVVLYVDDSTDGTGVLDENGIASDYKKIKTEISWDIRDKSYSVTQVANVVPNGIETLAGGGTLIINVFDSTAQPVEGAEVRVLNASATPAIDVTLLTNADGKVWFPGSPATNNYEIYISKIGYSSAQTYSVTASNVAPDPGHQSVLVGQTTQVSFAIDVLGSKLVSTFTPIVGFTWDDLFVDSSKVSVLSSTTISGGQLQLMDDAGTYRNPGTVQSLGISHSQLVSWSTMSWNDTVPPQTTLFYQLYYDNSGWMLVPDVDLSGNAAGFNATSISSVDISSLSTTTYSSLTLFATLSTVNTGVTPSIQDWQIDYDAGPIPLGNIDFQMRGAKEIGEDASAQPIYKYDTSLSTDASGVVHIDPLEWDVYSISVDDAVTGYDISQICEPQPFGLSANTDATTEIQLVADTTNSLLVTVENSLGQQVNGAFIRLYLGVYDETRQTAGCGQIFFEGLSIDEYDIEATGVGYSYTLVEDIAVDGMTEINIVIND